MTRASIPYRYSFSEGTSFPECASPLGGVCSRLHLIDVPSRLQSCCRRQTPSQLILALSVGTRILIQLTDSSLWNDPFQRVRGLLGRSCRKSDERGQRPPYGAQRENIRRWYVHCHTILQILTCSVPLGRCSTIWRCCGEFLRDYRSLGNFLIATHSSTNPMQTILRHAESCASILNFSTTLYHDSLKMAGRWYV